jgi:hypothetical protein
MKPHDIDLMQHADGELENEDLVREPGARDKVAAVHELGELVRGHLELQADHVPARRFDAIWREIDKATQEAPGVRQKAPTEETKVGHARGGIWRRVSRWFDRYRGHVITGAVTAGAVAGLALWLRGPSESGNGGGGALSVQPAAYRPTEIEEMDTPGGTGSVFNLKDDDGTTTVIWVTPEDTVEGI